MYETNGEIKDQELTEIVYSQIKMNPQGWRDEVMRATFSKEGHQIGVMEDVEELAKFFEKRVLHYIDQSMGAVPGKVIKACFNVGFRFIDWKAIAVHYQAHN